MTSRARWGFVGAAIILSLATADVASAQQSNAAAAQALFDQGRTFVDKKQYIEALDAFSRSQALDPSVGALINIAEIDEKLGRLASAWSAWSEAARLALATKQGNRAPVAQQNAARLAPKVARLSINAAPDRTAALNVLRNGIKQDSAALNTPVPVDAGHYVIEVSAPNKKPFATAVDIVDGATQAVQIPELEPDSSAASPPTPPPKPASDTQRNVGIGMEIGGGAVVLAGFIFGGVAMGKWNSVANDCPNGHCPTAAIEAKNQSNADSARTFSTISTVGVIAGAAILAGGVVLHLTAPKHDVAVGASLGHSAAGLTITFTD